MGEIGMINKETISCPKCGQHGESVAAINYRESLTGESVTKGAGIGPTFGSGGLGIAAIAMTAYTRHESRTKRAYHFWEPSLPEHQMTNEEIKHCGIAGTVVACSAVALVWFTLVTTEQVRGLLTVVLLFFLFISVIMVLVGQFDFAETDPNIKLREDYELARDMFYRMQYCDNCFLVYDENGNRYPADKDGYYKMINLNSPLKSEQADA